MPGADRRGWVHGVEVGRGLRRWETMQVHEEAALFRDQTQKIRNLLQRLPKGLEGMGHPQAANELNVIGVRQGLSLSTFASLKLKHCNAHLGQLPAVLNWLLPSVSMKASLSATQANGFDLNLLGLVELKPFIRKKNLLALQSVRNYKHVQNLYLVLPHYTSSPLPVGTAVKWGDTDALLIKGSLSLSHGDRHPEGPVSAGVDPPSCACSPVEGMGLSRGVCVSGLAWPLHLPHTL